jgi:glyoxylase-like metal-dependent hydrolase (beta-lactamase superfamily II)
MKIEIIDTGYFYADGGAMFGAIPKTSWLRRYPANEKNQCILAMRSLLVTTETGRIILVDNGAGDKHARLLSYFRFFDLKDLNGELQKRGIRPGDVTDVVLTHLHFDHCGYTTRQTGEDGKLTPTFPNARHWVGRSQWENFRRPNALEKDSFFPENMMAAEEAGLIRFIHEETEICPGFSLRLYDGHTMGQIVPYIRTPECTFVFAGDVIPLVANLSLEWISAYDTHPLTSYAEKSRLLEEAARENQTLIYCHDAYTRCTTVKKIKEFYRSAIATTSISNLSVE